VISGIIDVYSLAYEKYNLLTQHILGRSKFSNVLSIIQIYLYRFIRGVGYLFVFNTTDIKYFQFIGRRSKQLTLWE